MSSPAFDRAFDRLIGNEGGYTDGAGDPGGETNWGISHRSYPTLDIKALTRDQAKAIYWTDFWLRLKAEDFPASIGYQAFDFAVNSGIETAVRYLQRAVGVADDGHWGQLSQSALAAMSESDILMRFAAERLDFITRLSTWATFGKGLVRRVAQDLRYGADDS